MQFEPLIDEGFIIGGSGGGGVADTFIQDTATTTGFYTEDEANIAVVKSGNTGTDSIFKVYESGGTSVFEIDGGGNIYNNGSYQLVKDSNGNLIVGTESTHSTMSSTAYDNIFIGSNVGDAVIHGDNNTFVGNHTASNVTYAIGNSGYGRQVFNNLTTGSYNTAIGLQSGYSLTTQGYNTFIGSYSGLGSIGDQNIFIGTHAGRKQTTAVGTLLIGSYYKADIATELSESLIYGVMNADPALQTLQTNAQFKVRYEGSSGNAFIVENNSGIEVLQVDYNGALYYDSNKLIQNPIGTTTIEVGRVGANSAGSGNVLIGLNAALNAPSNVTASVMIGSFAGRSSQNNYKVLIGYYAGYTTTGDRQIFIGSEAGHSGSSHDDKIGIGHRAGTGGTAGIFIGKQSGDFITGTDNYVVIDPLNRVDEAGELTESIIVGKVNADAALQTLQTNSQFTVSYQGTSGNALIVDDGTNDVMTVDYEGTVTIGNATNNVEISKTLGKRYNGTSTVWKDMVMDLFGRRLNSVVGTVDYDYDENSITFSPNGGITDINDRIGGNQEINHEFKVGTSITFKPHVHWWQQVTSGAVDSIVFTARWRLQRNNAAKATTWTTITASAGTTDDIYDFTSEADGLYNQITRFDDITVTCGLSDTIQVQLTRTDTETGDVDVIFFDMHGEVDSDGSEDEISKT